MLMRFCNEEAEDDNGKTDINLILMQIIWAQL